VAFSLKIRAGTSSHRKINIQHREIAFDTLRCPEKSERVGDPCKDKNVYYRLYKSVQPVGCE
jgi:hypothetical protein